MLLLARCALCIGIVVAMLPDSGGSARGGIAAGVSDAAFSRVRSALGYSAGGARRNSGLTQDMDVARVGGALALSKDVPTNGLELARAAGVAPGFRAMLKLATKN